MDLEAITHALQQLLDRESIRNLLFAYCHALDRQDEAGLRKIYWPDAIDMHGEIQGTADEFVRKTVAKFAGRRRSIHSLANIAIEMDGNSAFVETYVHGYHLEEQPQRTTLLERFSAGRYADVFDKRGGEWRILKRLVVYDWLHERQVEDLPDSARFGKRMPTGTFFPHDASCAQQLAWRQRPTARTTL